MSMPELILTEFVPLAALTSWRIGGVARYLATVRSPHGVAEAIAFADSRMLPVWILGGGSNMLISDDGLPGVVIRMRDMHIDITDAILNELKLFEQNFEVNFKQELKFISGNIT